MRVLAIQRADFPTYGMEGSPFASMSTADLHAVVRNLMLAARGAQAHFRANPTAHNRARMISTALALQQAARAHNMPGMGADAWGNPDKGDYGPAAAPAALAPVPAAVLAAATSPALPALTQTVASARAAFFANPTAENRAALFKARQERRAEWLAARQAARAAWRAANPQDWGGGRGWGHGWRNRWRRHHRGPQGWPGKAAGSSTSLGPVLPGPLAPMNFSPSLIATGAVAPAVAAGTPSASPLPAPTTLSGMGRHGRGGHRVRRFRAGSHGGVVASYGYPIVIEQGNDEERFQNVSPAFAGLYAPKSSASVDQSDARQLSGPLDSVLSALGLRDPIAASYPNMPLSAVWKAVRADIDLSMVKLPGLRSDRKRQELAGRVDQLNRMAADVEPAFRKPDSQIGKRERDKLAEIILKLDTYTKDWRAAKKQYGYADPDAATPEADAPPAPPPAGNFLPQAEGIPAWLYVAGGALALLALAGRRG